MKPQRFAGKWKSAGFVPADVASPLLAPRFVRPRGDDERHSLDTGAAPALAKTPAQYTGTAALGIATMHKSNAVPVFSRDEAVEVSRMRRG